MFFHTWAAYQGIFSEFVSVTINIHGPAEVECLQNNFLACILNIFLSAANTWLHQAGWYVNWNKRLPRCFLLHYIILSWKGISYNNTCIHNYYSTELHENKIWTTILLPKHDMQCYCQLLSYTVSNSNNDKNSVIYACLSTHIRVTPTELISVIFHI